MGGVRQAGEQHVQSAKTRKSLVEGEEEDSCCTVDGGVSMTRGVTGEADRARSHRGLQAMLRRQFRP